MENLGVVRGVGRLAARWAGIPGRATLKVESIDFNGEIDFKDACETYVRVGVATRRLKPGKLANVVYRDDWMEKIGAAVGGRDFSVQEIVRSDDSDAQDQADRVARFFQAARGKNAPQVPIRVDASLSPRTLRVGGVEISSCDRDGFSKQAKRFLDILNAVRHPNYRPPARLQSCEKGRYRLFRL